MQAQRIALSYCGLIVNRAGNQSFLKAHNRDSLLRLLYTHPGVSRAELARLSSLTKMTVGALVSDSIAAGWIREGGASKGASGRPGWSLELNPDLLCAIGAEIGVKELRVVACNVLGGVIADRHISNLGFDDPLEVCQHLALEVAALLGQPEMKGRRVLGMGVSVPGPVLDGVLHFAPNLGWSQIWVLELLRPLLPATLNLQPLRLENEANAAALGAYFFRVGAKPRSVVYLSLGVGVGCGIVIEGQVFRGADGYAGEVGHTVLHPPSGRVEDYVSQRALAERLNLDVATEIDALLLRASSQPAAVAAFANELGLVLANLIGTFSPDELLIGGPLSRLGQALLEPAQMAMRSSCNWRSFAGIEVRLSARPSSAAAIGAAANVLHELLGGSRVAVG